jgi:hypothetical protein
MVDSGQSRKVLARAMLYDAYMRLTQVLAQIVGVASLSTACSDDEQCYVTSSTVTPYEVVVTGSGEGGASDGAGGGAAAGAGGEVETPFDCLQVCTGATSCQVLTESLGRPAVVRCFPPAQSGTAPCPRAGVSEGRRPAGLVEPHGAGAEGTALGTLFAQMAYLEAASIHAFTRLRRELREHGASASLLRLVAQAARDEVRHARQMSTLASSHGAVVPRVELGAFRVRPLFELACENEVEGCVRETFGALVALWQAEHAGTPELRALFRGIALDEARHAELAWLLRDWFRARLDAAGRERLERVGAAAQATLAAEVSVAVPRSWQDTAGIPDAYTASHLLSRLRSVTVEDRPRLAPPTPRRNVAL